MRIQSWVIRAVTSVVLAACVSFSGQLRASPYIACGVDGAEYRVVVYSSDCDLRVTNAGPIRDDLPNANVYALLGRWHVGRSECNRYPNGVGHTGCWYTATGRLDVVINSGWMALYGKGRDLLVIAEHDDIAGISYRAPAGYVKIASWHVGGGATDGHPRLYDAYGRTLSSGWIALCISEHRVGDFDVLVERDDCANRSFALPSNAKWFGSWHVGTGHCDEYPRGVGLSVESRLGVAISSGWLTFVEWKE